MDNLTETKLTSEKIYSGCILDFYRDTVRLVHSTQQLHCLLFRLLSFMFACLGSSLVALPSAV